MNFLIIGIGFVILCAIIGIVVAKFVVDALPQALKQAAPLQLIVGYGLAVVGVVFLMQWGYDPIIISVGANELFLDPRRWLWWFLSALFIGAAEGFLFRVRLATPAPSDEAADSRP